MKHIFYIFTLAIAALSLVACNNDDEQAEVKTYTIDFEDNLFDADVADIASTWSFVKEGYSWIEPHTSLYHETEFTYDYGYAMFGGGLILSSYNSNDPASFGTYEQDLYIYNSKTRIPKRVAVQVAATHSLSPTATMSLRLMRSSICAQRLSSPTAELA